MKEKSKTGATPVCLLAVLPGLVALAEQYGYMLAPFGSLRRDYDLIAVPWIHNPKTPDELVDAIVEYVGGRMIDDPDCDPYDYTRQRKEPKYHGRWAYSIYLTADDAGAYIDLSVMQPEEDALIKSMHRMDERAKAWKAARKAAGQSTD